MNKLIVVVPLLLLAAMSRTVAAGVADLTRVSLESTTSQVRQSMSVKHGVKLSSETSNRLQFAGGAFGGSKVKSWDFEFKNGKLTRVTVLFVVRQGSNARGYEANQDFAEMTRALEKQNGKPKLSHGPTYEESSWGLSNPRQTIKLLHGWTGGVKGSSRIELTFSR